tara:strand:+ start:40857 stop:41492 length:636 start_codon:yes stop_codon:yes gene_type:complete
MENHIKSILSELANVNKLILLDLDDTLVEAAEIFIYKQLPNGEEIRLTPSEYADEDVENTDATYDYRDFNNPKTVKRSIKKGQPIVPNLEIMDELLKKGYDIGILTARGMEDVIYSTLREWLMIRDKNGELTPIGDKLSRENVFAVNDPKYTELEKYTDYQKKSIMINDLLDDYDEIIFIDDDNKNLKEMHKLKQALNTIKANKLFIMKAK